MEGGETNLSPLLAARLGQTGTGVPSQPSLLSGGGNLPLMVCILHYKPSGILIIYTLLPMDSQTTLPSSNLTETCPSGNPKYINQWPMEEPLLSAYMQLTQPTTLKSLPLNPRIITLTMLSLQAHQTTPHQ